MITTIAVRTQQLAIAMTVNSFNNNNSSISIGVRPFWLHQPISQAVDTVSEERTTIHLVFHIT